MSSHLYVCGHQRKCLRKLPVYTIHQRKEKKNHLCHGVLFFPLPIWWLTHCFLPDCRIRKQNNRLLEAASMNSSMLIGNKRPMDVLEKNHGFNSVQGCCPLNFYMLEILPIPLVKMHVTRIWKSCFFMICFYSSRTWKAIRSAWIKSTEKDCLRAKQDSSGQGTRYLL